MTSAQPDNLKAGLSKNGKIDDYHKTWNFINNFTVLKIIVRLVIPEELSLPTLDSRRLLARAALRKAIE